MTTEINFNFLKQWKLITYNDSVNRNGKKLTVIISSKNEKYFMLPIKATIPLKFSSVKFWFGPYHHRAQYQVPTLRHRELSVLWRILI